MPKSRFSAADIRGIVRDLRGKVLGLRCINVYDISAKIYLIKLGAPGVSEKPTLLLESGMRFHSTSFVRDKSDMPSGFAMKLRKHIRAKRLEDIKQLGVDRVVDFRFGSGDNCCHVILEMYSGGNIILTDQHYEILALLRTHKFEDNVLTAVRELYPVDHATTLLGEQGEDSNGAAASGFSVANSTPQDLLDWINARISAGEAAATAAASDSVVAGAAANAKVSGKAKKASKLSLKQALADRGSSVAQFGSDIIHHCILHAGMNPNLKLSSKAPLSLDEAGRLLSSMSEATRVYKALDTPGQPGYILCKDTVTLEDGTQQARYDDVVPALLAQHEGAGQVMEFPSFDAAVDEYFCRLEEQRLVSAADSMENAIKQRVEKIRTDQQERLDTLARSEQQAMRKAQLVETRADDIDKVIMVMRSAIENGVDWDDLHDYVMDQQAKGNPIAHMIHALKLETNAVVVLLEDDEEEGAAAAFAVDINLGQSAHSNARRMFAHMKVAQKKKAKTAEASARVVQVAEKQSADALKQHYSKRQLKAVRKVYWFEKFNWFITSENFLVLAGRDAQQNDTLVKKYLRQGDAYVHADLHGASSCILRNKDPKGVAELSPLALHEAGCMTVCRSAAWKSKMFASAWWVHASQVSKTAPTGEYLSTGSFMIRGKKNFLPPVQLEMGLALLFRLDDSCIGRHLDERRERALGSDDDNDDDDNDDGGGQEKAPKPASRGGIKPSRPPPPNLPAAPASELPPTDPAAAPPAPPADVAAEREALIAQSPLPLPAPEVAEEQEGDSTGDGEAEEEEEVEEEEEQEQSGGGGNSGEERGKGGDGTATEDGEKSSAVPALSSGSGEGEVSPAPPSSSFVTPRERKLMKKKGWTLEQVRAETRLKQEQTAAAPPEAKLVKKDEPPPRPGHPRGGVLRGKRGKQRKIKQKYADQDEEDLELHRIAVGHQKLEDEEEEADEDEAAAQQNRLHTEETISKVLRGDSEEALAELPAAIRAEFDALVDRNLLRIGELDVFELRMLASLPEDVAEETMKCFRETDLRKVGNKSGLLSGIMRRIGQQKRRDGAVGGEEEEPESAGPAAADGEEESARAHKKRMEAEMKQLLEEEGIAEGGDDDAQAGSYVAQLNGLTGNPREDDTLLFAVPVCAPYFSLKRYKYVAKLTPGTQKKGKAGRQCLDLFSRSKDCLPRQRDLIKQCSDNEVVSAILGEVKISAAGLQKQQSANRQQKKKKGKAKKSS